MQTFCSSLHFQIEFILAKFSAHSKSKSKFKYLVSGLQKHPDTTIDKEKELSTLITRL